MTGVLERPQVGKGVPIILHFFVASADMAVGTKKGQPNRFRVDPEIGDFTLRHVEIEHAVSASVTVDVNKGAGDGAASTIFTTQGNRPATSGATRNKSSSPNIIQVNGDDYFEIDIDALSGSPGDMSVYIRGIKEVATLRGV